MPSTPITPLRRRKLAVAFALTAAVAVAAPPASASAAPTPDLIRPAGNPVELRAAPRKLTVTYTHDGQERTLADFLGRTKTNGFVVLDGQKIVYERYAGASRDTRFQSWSMAKSFASAAVGIALSEGRIRSVSDPVTKYLPELRGSGYDGVSIRDLLRMSSGIDWNEREDVARVQVAANKGYPVKKLAAAQERGWEPGSRFEYTSMNSFVLARLVSKATGTPYHRYVERKIWRPAGMADTADIGNDGNGDNLGYCCFYATARDYARFGLLYLRDGRAKNRQVVPAAWVKRSTTPSGVNPRYGLHWWLGGDGAGDFMAAGFGGQYIYVSPEHGVVIVRSTHSTSPNDQEEELTVFRAVAAEVARTR